MIVEHVSIENFRCLKSAEARCTSLTAFVGANGTGKSCFLEAIKLFFDSRPMIGEDDFYNKDTSVPISISVTMSGLKDFERSSYARYVHDDKLVLKRAFSWRDGGVSTVLEGFRRRNPDFNPIREASTAADAKDLFRTLRANQKYASMPSASTRGAIDAAMDEWEEQNPDACILLPDDGFFSLGSGGDGDVLRTTHVIAIPAVSDAAVVSGEGRSSPATQLMDILVRQELEESGELERLEAETRAKYDAILGSSVATSIASLEKKISSTLAAYVPTASVKVTPGSEAAITIRPPQAQMRLVEDGFASTVDRSGHGLQRALILSLLQEFTLTSRGGADSPDQFDLILCMEEPEIYQHPNRQRHLAALLLKLAGSPVDEIVSRTQVLYTTHSPLFVGIDRLEQIRLVRKQDGADGQPKITSVASLNLEKVAASLWDASEKTAPVYTAIQLMPRLQAVMTPWTNEGFFAKAVLLVEGESDRAVMLAAAQAMGVSLEERGISIIPCMGKSKLDRPAVVFRGFGIPTYMMWDSDRSVDDKAAAKSPPQPRSNLVQNRFLLRLNNAPEEDYPDGVKSQFACFEQNLEITLEEELGAELLGKCLEDAKERYGFSGRDDALKSPEIMTSVLRQAYAAGGQTPTIASIIESVVAISV